MKKSAYIVFFLMLTCSGFWSYAAQSADLSAISKKVMPSLLKELSKKRVDYGNPIFIRIFKEERELELWVRQKDSFVLFKTYPICYHSGTLGPKLKEGDGQSPEGFYFVTPARMNPNSSYHLSFNIGFPNAYDRAHGRTGSYLMVHGNCVSIGCYAMTDSGIEEIYLLANAALKGAQPFFRVHIFPFRMTQDNMEKHKGSAWLDFWRNLKEGYDHFEQYNTPPSIEVNNKRYVVTHTEQ